MEESQRISEEANGVDRKGTTSTPSMISPNRTSLSHLAWCTRMSGSLHLPDGCIFPRITPQMVVPVNQPPSPQLPAPGPMQPQISGPPLQRLGTACAWVPTGRSLRTGRSTVCTGMARCLMIFCVHIEKGRAARATTPWVWFRK